MKEDNQLDKVQHQHPNALKTIDFSKLKLCKVCWQTLYMQISEQG